MEMDSSCRFTLPQDLELRLSNMHLWQFCAYDIGENKKSVCAGQHTGSFLLCKPACSRSAAAAGADEMVPAPWGKYPEF